MLTLLDILGIFAHPDDAELGAGGTLALEASRGRKVGVVDLTCGERGTRGTPESRKAEAGEAARILGLAHREQLGLPDAGLTTSAEHKDVVVGALRRLRPRVVILQDRWQQQHPDHIAASRIGEDACFLAALANYRPDLGAPHRAARVVFALAGGEPPPTGSVFAIDITSTFETKRAAARAFASQFSPPPGATPLALDRQLDAIEITARHWGHKLGVSYAEAFVTRDTLLVPDLLFLDGHRG